jgi:hypothetical protein
MKVFNMLLIIVLCFSFIAADDGDKKKIKKDEEQQQEQLRYERMLKAYEEDKAASERIEAQYVREESIKTEDSQDDNATENGSETIRDKKEEEIQEVKEEE